MDSASAELAVDPELSEGENDVILAERYRILPGSLIAELGTPGAKAYIARNLKKSERVGIRQDLRANSVPARRSNGAAQEYAPSLRNHS